MANAFIAGDIVVVGASDSAQNLAAKKRNTVWYKAIITRRTDKINKQSNINIFKNQQDQHCNLQYATSYKNHPPPVASSFICISRVFNNSQIGISCGATSLLFNLARCRIASSSSTDSLRSDWTGGATCAGYHFDSRTERTTTMPAGTDPKARRKRHFILCDIWVLYDNR